MFQLRGVVRFDSGIVLGINKVIQRGQTGTAEILEGEIDIGMGVLGKGNTVQVDYGAKGGLSFRIDELNGEVDFGDFIVDFSDQPLKRGTENQKVDITVKEGGNIIIGNSR